MKLLFNADDFGLSSGVNRGIIHAFMHGVVRSTTLMTNLGETTLEAIAFAKAHPSFDIGVHLNMFIGPSLTGVIPGCTDEHGIFFKWIQNPADTPQTAIDWTALKHELRAQIDFAFEHGLEPTHLDSHRHGHLHPELLDYVYDLAHTYHLKVRNFDLPLHNHELAVTQAFTTAFYGDAITLNDLQTVIRTSSVDVDSLEIMCHPAYVDELLQARSSYVCAREQELAVLTSPELFTWLAENNHELINFQK